MPGHGFAENPGSERIPGRDLLPSMGNYIFPPEADRSAAGGEKKYGIWISAST
jgi:hypothetical protein